MVLVLKPVVKTPVPALYARGYTADNEDVASLLLNVFQSVEERYPFVLVLAWLIEIVFEEIERGDVAEVIRFWYAVSQFVVLAVSGMLYPAVREKTPVALVYVRPVAVEESAARARVSV